MDKMVLVSKYFPGVLSSGESLARAQDELNRTYEQASVDQPAQSMHVIVKACILCSFQLGDTSWS